MSHLIDVAIAERDYHATMPHHLYSTPLHLVDWPFWQRSGRLAMLPLSYSADRADSYRFDFQASSSDPATGQQMTVLDRFRG